MNNLQRFVGESSNSPPVEAVGKRVAPSFDMVAFSQFHADAPELGADRVMCVESSGEVKWESLKTLMCEGSYSSRYFIRSWKGWVTLRFNPSRLYQPHSLDGVADMCVVLDMANALMRKHGLPEFYEVDSQDVENCRDVSRRSALGSDSADVLRGVRIGMVHVCTGYFVGSEARSFIAESSRRKIGNKFGFLHADGSSAWWSSKRSRYWSAKLYMKFDELLAHYGAECEPLANWCRDTGFVRHEVELYSRWLKSEGLDIPSKWSAEAMDNVLLGFQAWSRDPVERPRFDDVAERLMALGVSVRRAAAAQYALVAYAHGQDVFRRASRATGFRLRADLLKVGVDISLPPAKNVVPLNQPVKVIEIRPAYLPERFWRKPVDLDAVAAARVALPVVEPSACLTATDVVIRDIEARRAERKRRKVERRKVD